MAELSPVTSGSGFKLLVLIAKTEESFDPIVTSLLDAGITGATIVESRGLTAILRLEMPIFSGLAALLPQSTGARMVFSVCSAADIARVEQAIARLPESQRPIGVVLPVERSIGMGG